MTRVLRVMTTDTVNHTFTTTIASSPTRTTNAFSRAPRVDVDVSRGRCARGRRRWGRRGTAHVDGFATRARSIARTRRRRRIRILTASTCRRTSPTTAFERIRARHFIRALPRIFARIRRTRARIRRARRERRDSKSREAVFERDREGETRARCETGRREDEARARRDARRGTWDERNAFCPERVK
jgi:hypothetical protein